MVNLLEPKGTARRHVHSDGGAASPTRRAAAARRPVRPRRGRHRAEFWDEPGLRLVRSGLLWLKPDGAGWWGQFALTVFAIVGSVAHVLGMYETAHGARKAAYAWFGCGTVLWIGAFIILILFIGPVTKARHRR